MKMRNNVFTIDTVINKQFNIKFSQPLGYVRQHFAFDAVDHKQLASDIAKAVYPTASVIVFERQLAGELWDNSEHMQKENQVMCSQVESQVRKEMMNMNAYPSWDGVMDLLHRLDIPLWETNYSDLRQQENSKWQSQLFDLVCQAYEYTLWPGVIENFKDDFL